MCNFWEKLRGLKKLSPHPQRNYIIRPVPHILPYPGPQPAPHILPYPCPQPAPRIPARNPARTGLVWPAARTAPQQINNPACGGPRAAGPRGLHAETRPAQGLHLRRTTWSNAVLHVIPLHFFLSAKQRSAVNSGSLVSYSQEEYREYGSESGNVVQTVWWLVWFNKGLSS